MPATPHSPPESPESRYIAAVDRTHRKQWGQFFTPEPVANLMADWVAQGAPERVCDPAAGTGVLARAVARRLPDAEIVALEKDPGVASFMDVSGAARPACQVADYLRTETSGMDAFIVNPPYVKHGNLADYAPERAQLNEKSGSAIAKMANLYVYFGVKILSDLKPGGRAAMLLPGEWMNAKFAVPFKAHLLATGALREIVAFANGDDVFEDALTTASLVFMEKPV